MKDKVEISVQYLIESGMYGVFSDGLLIELLTGNNNYASFLPQTIGIKR